MNIFSSSKSKNKNIIDLTKISTIEECRDLIIILSSNMNKLSDKDLISVNDNAIKRFPSLQNLKV